MTVLASGILLYRPATRVDDARILLLRNRDNGQWGFPKGRRDPDDAHEIVTAIREVREETAYEGLVLHPTFRRSIEYRVEGTEDNGRWKRVAYFLARAPAHEPILSAEHSEFSWSDRQTLYERLAYGQLRDLAFHAILAIPREDGPQPAPTPPAPR
jgi:8-oxo-dGTP pyrophosphatase MutT (NUDIX family)